jgi:hypothetical protein
MRRGRFSLSLMLGSRLYSKERIQGEAIGTLSSLKLRMAHGKLNAIMTA